MGLLAPHVTRLLLLCLPAWLLVCPQVTKVELLLNYEGAVCEPLAIGSIDNFLLELAVHPATLQVRHGTQSCGDLCTQQRARSRLVCKSPCGPWRGPSSARAPCCVSRWLHQC